MKRGGENKQTNLFLVFAVEKYQCYRSTLLLDCDHETIACFLPFILFVAYCLYLRSKDANRTKDIPMEQKINNWVMVACRDVGRLCNSTTARKIL